MSTVFTQAITDSLNVCMSPKLQNFNSSNTNNIFEQLFTLLIYNNMTTDECNLVMGFSNKL